MWASSSAVKLGSARSSDCRPPKPREGVQLRHQPMVSMVSMVCLCLDDELSRRADDDRQRYVPPGTLLREKEPYRRWRWWPLAPSDVVGVRTRRFDALLQLIGRSGLERQVAHAGMVNLALCTLLLFRPARIGARKSELRVEHKRHDAHLWGSNAMARQRLMRRQRPADLDASCGGHSQNTIFLELAIVATMHEMHED
eukprot:2597565-Prymnesium_polylepis.2